MAKLRPEEEWARRIIEAHLGRTVDAHDDNSATNMFDLRVGPVDAPEIAIEVTGAIDPPWTATWNAAQKRTGNVPGIVDDWTIVVRAGAQIHRIERELPALLTAVRATGLKALHDTDWFREPELRGLCNQLGIKAVYRLGSPGTGFVHYTNDGDGGAVDSFGVSVPGWLGEFLTDPKRADNLRKLAATTAAQREVFVIADVKGAPWSVMSYLTDIAGRGCPLPPAVPDLPEPLTGVWLSSTFSFRDGSGVRWDGTAWSSFRSRGAGIDEDEG